MAKEVTREKAEHKKAQAAEFMQRIGDPDRADEYDEMSVDEYADHRGLRLANPDSLQRRNNMSTSTGPTKADLQDQLDRALTALQDAYTPEASREDLAEAMGDALDILTGDDEDEEIEEADDVEDDTDDDLD